MIEGNFEFPYENAVKVANEILELKPIEEVSE